VQTLEELRNESIAPQRLNATLIGLFAGLALAIATVGVAGVLGFSVSQRTNELGIRVALGAKRGTILRMILGEGAAMALIGLAVGGIAAVPLSRLLNGLLFGIEPTDPQTIANHRDGGGRALRGRDGCCDGARGARDGSGSDDGASGRMSAAQSTY
jgi:putative ABC transport system permease protein